MAFVTRQQAVNAAATRGNKQLAEARIRTSASAPQTTVFDVFLSHAFEDAELIAGIKQMLETEGLQVYVDWMEDPVQRGRITVANANTLRVRMNHCRFLLYISSRASAASRWTPWELGYFDGRRPGRVGVMPVVERTGESYRPAEYLGLYPLYELVDFTSGRRLLAHRTGTTTATTLSSLAKS